MDIYADRSLIRTPMLVTRCSQIVPVSVRPIFFNVPTDASLMFA